jgi:acetyl esterase
MPLHPQAQAFLDAIAEKNPPGWEELSPTEGRKIFSEFGDLFGEGPAVARVEDHTTSGGVKLRLYSDEASGNQAATMYFHGGGWVLGNIDTHDALCRRLAKQSGCTVVSVEYSLSPESRFPQPLDDCFAATCHVADNAADIGIDASRLAVAGDSAGGNLATAVTLKSRDQSGPSIKLQVLIYPVIEPTFDTESYQSFGSGHGLSLNGMRWFWDQYLGEQTPLPLAVPSRATSLEGLPAAHVITAEYDVLRCEGEAYARQLESAGVPTTTKRYLGCLHGFVHFAGMFDDGIRATADIAEILRAKLVRHQR